MELIRAHILTFTVSHVSLRNYVLRDTGRKPPMLEEKRNIFDMRERAASFEWLLYFRRNPQVVVKGLLSQHRLQ